MRKEDFWIGVDQRVDFRRITRLEIIGEAGREWVEQSIQLEPSIQDKGRTLKLFIKRTHRAATGRGATAPRPERADPEPQES